MVDSFDEQLKRSLRRGTDPASRMQDEVWARIQERLATEADATSDATSDATTAPVSAPPPSGPVGGAERAGERRAGPRRRLRRLVAGTAAAAALMTAFLAAAPPGQALVAEVRSWFAPEKTVDESFEGIPGSAEAELQEGASGYVIYFDEEKFRMVRGDGVDRIVPVDPPGAAYPEVYMEISRSAEAPLEVARSLAETAREPTLLGPREVASPVEGWEVYAVGGTGGLEWNDPVVRYLAFPDGAGGSFIAKQNYFLEAEEGYGARFQLMLKEFHIIEKPQGDREKERDTDE